MKLLITNAEYSANIELASATSNQVSVTVNNVAGTLCDITDLALFNQIRLSMNKDNYAVDNEGILIPKAML